jgi:hypothetical protein
MKKIKKIKAFVCHHCKESITEVYVISEYTQSASLIGDKIVEYDEVDDIDAPIGPTIDIRCKLCDGSLIGKIKD